MSELAVSDRIVARVLAVIPAVVVALAVRVLTLGSPAPVLRVAAAGLVAVAAWTAYRLLTVKVTVTDEGVAVRGVFYDAVVPFADIDRAEPASAHPALRALVWGMLHPTAVELCTPGRSLRPLALISVADDDDVDRLLSAIRARTGAWRVPAQREPADTGITTG